MGKGRPTSVIISDGDKRTPGDMRCSDMNWYSHIFIGPMGCIYGVVQIGMPLKDVFYKTTLPGNI